MILDVDIDDDPPEIPVSTTAVGVRLRDGEFESGFHEHAHAQLMLLTRGDVTCKSDRGLWVVPPQTALWVPAQMSHKVKVRTPLEGYALFVEPAETVHLPRTCGAIAVTPLLRELLARAAELPFNAAREGVAGRVFGLILDELGAARVDEHPLPMPSDPRLWPMVDALAKDPADGATLKVWAKRLGLGERTLNRLLVAETGLSFGRWRQQLHVVLAMKRLASGATVQNVALDLGYESASSFVTMFKRTVGETPGRYALKKCGPC